MLGTGFLARKSLRYFWRSHLALALGIAAATAVIVGALVVGDSVRGSLRGLVFTRLANIEALLRTREFVDPELFAKLKESQTSTSLKVVPFVFLTNSSAEHRANDQTRRATQVQVLAIDQDFVGSLEDAAKQELLAAPGPDEVILNQALANELSVKVGDQITVLLSSSGGVPPDTPLGRRDINTKNLPRQKVVRIVSDQSVGAIAFQSTQEVQKNVFACLQTVQELLERENKFNAAVAFSARPSTALSQAAVVQVNQLSSELKPRLEDFGLKLTRHRRVFPDEDRGEKSDQPPVTVFDYYQLTSRDLLIDQSTSKAVVNSVGPEKCSQLFSFLVNSIQKAEVRTRPSNETNRVPSMPLSRALGVAGAVRTKTPTLNGQGRLVPYSIVVGVSLGSELDLTGLDQSVDSLRGTTCIANSWLANELGLQEDDRLQLELYEPETIDGRPVKAYTSVRVVGTVNVEEPITPYRRNRPAVFDKAPTAFNDPDLTPTVDGITDQASISSWDVPFELELKDKILKQDDQYYDNHRLTPKLFLPLFSAQQLAGSRFGDITSIRIPADKFDSEAEIRAAIEAGLNQVTREAGLVFQPIRQQMLASATGTTPFDMLFLSLSSFVIIAALMLVALLFKLSVQQRTSQIGLLYSQGFTIRRVQRLLISELLIVAALGGMIGIPLGLGYAKLMILGLESWWVGAISSRFLSFSFTPVSLTIGFASGVLASLLTILLSLRKISAASPLSLLRGVDLDLQTVRGRLGTTGWSAPIIAAIAALGLSLLASKQTGMGRAGSFFGVGMLLLLSSWLAVRQILLRQPKVNPSRQGLSVLAAQAIRRNPVRSSLSIGLLAVASFLIASLGVFRMSPSKSGYGGFDLMAISSQPIYENMGSPAARRELIGAEADQMRSAVVMPFRMREGDDASCNNLYQPKSPTILGVTPSLQNLTESVSDYEFAWAASARPNSPWDALNQYGTGAEGQPIPVILDQNTAMWSLKQGATLGSSIEIEIDGNPTFFRVVGLLNNSILQGKLIISEQNFQVMFPKISGYRFFLISSGSSGKPDQITSILESGLSSAGMDVQSSAEVLEKLLGVQNTYISAFQSLGALGLLLGTIGLVAVQLRSVWERRKELALMQAVGFSKLRIGNLLTIETTVLLGLGLLIGVLAAAVALIPFVLQVGPELSLIQPIGMLGVVFACGFFSAALAIRFALRLPLLASLRSE